VQLNLFAIENPDGINFELKETIRFQTAWFPKLLPPTYIHLSILQGGDP